MEKQKETAFFGYFVLLLLLVISNMYIDTDVISLGYLVVVLCSFFKLVLIVYVNKK